MRIGGARPWEVAVAAAVAGSLSGAPSTVHALLTGRSPLAAARAAGELLGAQSLARGAVAHAAVSLGWTTVLALVLPPRRRVPWGAACGLAIGVLDLSIARRRYPAIAALPTAAQLADHAAFGALAAAALPAHARSAVHLRGRHRPCSLA